MKHKDLYNISYRSKCTVAYLIVTDVLKKIEYQAEEAVKKFLDGAGNIALNNACENFEYLLAEALWLVESFEELGYDMKNVRENVETYATSYKEDFKYFFRRCTEDYNWDEMRAMTSEELMEQHDRITRGNKLAMDILNEIMNEEKPADHMTPENRRMYEAAFQRPTNFFKLSSERQWEIDKDLGILDWDGEGLTEEEKEKLNAHFNIKKKSQ